MSLVSITWKPRRPTSQITENVGEREGTASLPSGEKLTVKVWYAPDRSSSAPTWAREKDWHWSVEHTTGSRDTKEEALAAIKEFCKREHKKREEAHQKKMEAQRSQEQAMAELDDFLDTP